MTEVHRYQVVTMLSEAGATIGYDPHGPEVVMASAFDETTRLFLDAAERCVASERREKELQQRLTATDQRIDELERDKVRIDWLAEQPVDTLYLDDGRIIDIAGRIDLRDAIDAAIALPVTVEACDD
ncbi:hypothetical protein [Pseudomonas fluorescens]